MVINDKSNQFWTRIQLFTDRYSMIWNYILKRFIVIGAKMEHKTPSPYFIVIDECLRKIKCTLYLQFKLKPLCCSVCENGILYGFM